MVFRRSLYILVIAVLCWGQTVRAHAKLNVNYVVMGYVQTYQNLNVNILPYNDMTHVIEAFALPSDTSGDITPASGLSGLVAAAHAQNVRVSISIGGQSSSYTNWSADVGASVVHTFVTNIMNLVSNGDGSGSYDGVDIDWEFPNNTTDANNFGTFMQLLYTQLHSQSSSVDGKPLNLSFFISPGGQGCKINYSTIWQYCDYGILSGYAYGLDAYNGPLVDTVTYTNCFGNSVHGDITDSINQLIAKSFPASQLVIGCPMYAEGPGNPTDNQVFSGGTAGAYNTPQAEQNYTYGGNTEIMDTHQSFCDKMNWAFTSSNFSGQTLAGIALWDIGFAYPPTQSLGGNAEVESIWQVIGDTYSPACFTPPPTPTFTPSPTPTNTFSPTPTDTPCMVAGVPCTSTATPTATNTATVTPTPGSVSTIITYPNPSSGQPINIRVPMKSAGDVKLQVFTVAFRKVWEQDFANVSPSAALTFTLTDQGGTQLANGLYYVVALTGGSAYKAKILILR